MLLLVILTYRLLCHYPNFCGISYTKRILRRHKIYYIFPKNFKIRFRISSIFKPTQNWNFVDFFQNLWNWYKSHGLQKSLGLKGYWKICCQTHEAAQSKISAGLAGEYVTGMETDGQRYAVTAAQTVELNCRNTPNVDEWIRIVSGSRNESQSCCEQTLLAMPTG